MTNRKINSVKLPAASPGTQRQLDFIHYGHPGQGPKAYLQAALHADEIPGLLVMHKFIQLLDQSDARDEIVGHIVLAPIANPVGSSQCLLGELSGRFDQASGINFNREYPDLAEQVAVSIGTKLGDDADLNVSLIRAAVLQILADQVVLSDVEVLKKNLLMNALDADIALDLHCDWQSVMHLYTGTPIWPQARDLAAYLGAEVSLLARVSGGQPFDEALSALWWQLADHFPDKAIPNACMAATIELRGKADVSERQAEQDAQALFHYLQSRGVISGIAPVPPDLVNEATPLSGVEKIVAPIAAVVSYNKAPGDLVAPGDVVCTLFDISQYDADKARFELTATVNGVLYAHRMDRLCRPGQVLCRIAGNEPLSDENTPLLDH